MRSGGFRGAVSFLTRLPVDREPRPTLARCVPWFPVVGALIGTVLAAVLLGLAQLVPMPVAAVVTVLAGVLLTGAFHEDGLADVADAFAGGWTTERRIEILADPLHGSYGVAALAGSIVVRATCLGLLEPLSAAVGLIGAHALGRAGAVGAMLVLPVAKRDGLGADYVHNLPRGPAVAGVLVVAALVASLAGWWVVPLGTAAVVAAGAVGRLAVTKLGGITGDVLGAIEQVGECLVLIVLTGLATRWVLWWQ